MMFSTRYLVLSLAAWTALQEVDVVEAAAIVSQKRFDHMDPMSHASQAFFQVMAKAAAARMNRRSVVIPSDGDDGKYVVDSRDSDPEGVIEVVTSEKEKMGDLWYDDHKATMFVSTSNHTTFQLHCAPDMHCQLLTLMYDDAAVVSRCMTYNQAGDGAMGFDVCSEDGINQTFFYEKSSGVVRPMVSNDTATTASAEYDESTISPSGNSTTPSGNSTEPAGNSTRPATGPSIEEEIMHENVMQIDARDGDVAEGATNVTLVFVPSYPMAPSMKQVHSLANNETETEEDSVSSSPTNSASMHTVTETVTVTASASPSLMNAAAAAATSSGIVSLDPEEISSASVPASSSVSMSSASPSPTVVDEWEVEVHAVGQPSGASDVSSSSAVVSSPAPSPSSTVDAAAIASSIAASGSQASATPTSSSSPQSEVSPSASAEVKKSAFTVRTDRDRFW